MGTFTKDQNNIVETLISVFTVDKGDIEVLLIKNKVDPYKGYWILPGCILNNQVTIEDSITDAVFDQTGLMNVYIEQGPVMSNINRYPDNRVLAITFLGLVDSTSVEINREERIARPKTDGQKVHVQIQVQVVSGVDFLQESRGGNFVIQESINRTSVGGRVEQRTDSQIAPCTDAGLAQADG